MGAKATRILVVEDDPMMREFVCEALQLEGLDVDPVDDGLKASRLLLTQNYDLLVTDVHLPGLSGVELFDLVRRSCPSTAAILLTGQPDLEEAVATVREGARNYLAKPVTASKLLDCVRDALRKREREEEPPEDTTVQLTRSGGHRVVRTLGVGSIGIVLLVEKDGVFSAMKILRRFPDQTVSPQAVLRFIQEGEIISSLDHEGIVKVYEYGLRPADNLPFILMEYVEGVPLSKVIAEEELSESEKIPIIYELALALEAVHKHGVLHRDVKPSNVLVQADRHVKLTDFGIARLDWSRLTVHGDVLGSPAYMAPESFDAGHEVDRRADLFSLGVVSYELLTGQVPFSGKTLLSVAHVVRKRRPVAPSVVSPELSPKLDDILGRMLQKSPKHRYASAGLVAEDLQRIAQPSADDAPLHAQQHPKRFPRVRA